jgi:hypothetical protein
MEGAKSSDEREKRSEKKHMRYKDKKQQIEVWQKGLE